VTYTVTANDETRHYTVNITNTGLPWWCFTNRQRGDFSKVYQGGVTIGGTNIGGKLSTSSWTSMCAARRPTGWG
jgi:hypothetical protein